MKSTAPAILAAACVSLSCSLLDAEWEVRRGVIYTTNDESRAFRAPDQILAGEPVTITVFTSGNLCFRPAAMHVELVDMVLSVEPYDSVNVGDGLCPDAPCRCRHVVEVTFPRRGEATLRIIGLPGDAASTPVTAEFPLAVE